MEVVKIPEGFTQLADETPPPSELIKKWARYSRGLGDAPEVFHTGGEIRSLVDVTYRDCSGVEVLGLPHDTRRLIPGYIQPGDLVFVWGHSPLRIYEDQSIPVVKTLRDVLRIKSALDWINIPHEYRSCWNYEMGNHVGHWAWVADRIDDEYMELEDEEERCDGFCYNRANLALSRENHFGRLSIPYVAKAWEEATKELDLDREFHYPD